MTESTRWEHLTHGSDIGVYGYGPTLATAFEQAALALMAIAADPATVTPAVALEIDCTAADDELLLVEWLDALIYEMATRRLVFGAVAVQIDDHHLQATVWGEPADPARHALGVEIKGATFTELCVQPQNGGWRAQCVVDV
jgi:tRNA nucleotidyltransferase (CCA-adding enzyme)